MSMDNLKISIEESVKAAFGDNAKYILQNWEFRQEFDFIIWAEENPSHTKYPISYEQHIEQALEKARWVHEHILTPATAQVGDGVTICYWSDRNAATVIKKTPFSLTVRRDKATLDPSFKPEWIPGGFSAICTNQGDQSYTYEPDPDGQVMTFRWSNKYGTYGQPGDLQLIKGRREFYDYNF